jgi:hypothetical protein
MSWLFSQALVAEYLGENFSDGELSAPLNGKPTQQAYCAPDKMTAFLRLSRFGMTYKPLTETRGEELLTLYLEDFHAKTSAPLEKAQALTESDQECGHKWRGWLAKYDPNTSLWRTAQCSLLEDLNESLATFPRSGMTRSGLLWELPMLEQATKEIASGLWGTPTTSQDFKPVRKLAPSEANGTHGTILVGSIGKTHPHLIGRYLKPLVTEYLMGWPIGWTDLKPLATDKSHFAPQQLGES